MTTNTKNQQGIVSILSVMFFMVLTSVITIGFARIMIQEQRQATDNALSASARNAAEAGIEDAKRALLDYTQTTDNGTKTTYQHAFDRKNCPGYLSADPGDSIMNRLGIKYVANQGVQVSRDDNYLEYYTCVIVTRNSSDYVRDITSANDSILVPLDGVSSFDTVEFSWNNSDDIIPEDQFSFGNPGELPHQQQWQNLEEPAFMRLQFITVQDPNNFSLDDISAGSRTLFLTPQPADPSDPDGLKNHISNIDNFDSRVNKDDQKPVGDKKQVQINCWNQAFSEDMPAYACVSRLSLGKNLGPIVPGGKQAYLRITPLYAGSHIRIRLIGGGKVVNFDGVQAVVDSTGKANDVFRRIQARVELKTDDLTPGAALEVGKGICKDFLVSSKRLDFDDACAD